MTVSVTILVECVLTLITPPAAHRHQSATLLSLLDTHQFIRYEPAKGQWYACEARGQDQAVLTLFCQALTLAQCEAVIDGLRDFLCVGGLSAHPLSGRYGETVVRAPVLYKQRDGLPERCSQLASALGVELGVQDQQPALAQPGVLVMDMDSTVIKIECIDEIAKLAGVGEQVSRVTEMAMRGELDFAQSLISRVACLKGVKQAQLAEIRDQIPLMPGISVLTEILKLHGWRIALASGGFTYFASYLQTRLGLDRAYANELEVADGTLTGKVTGDIVDADTKAAVVSALAEEYQVAPGQTVALGDGANDLVMMSQAGLGVACHGKPVVNEKADVAIRFSGLHGLLYFLR